MARIAGWVFTLPFLITLALLLVIFDVLQRIARLIGARPHEFVVGVLQRLVLWSLRLCGTRISVERAAGVRPRTAYLIVSNHQAMFDVPIIGGLLFTNYPKFVAKRELVGLLPSIAYNLRRGGNVVIDRDDGLDAVRQLRAFAASVRERGVSAVIFPEGTRSRDGQLRAFRPAGLRALLRAAPELPVVPVTIDGSWKLLRYGMRPVPFGTRVHVRFGEPIARAPRDDDAIVEAVFTELEQTLARWRRTNA